MEWQCHSMSLLTPLVLLLNLRPLLLGEVVGKVELCPYLLRALSNDPVGYHLHYDCAITMQCLLKA